MIQTKNLGFSYPHGSPLVFDDVAVPQGGTLLLRGASGSGKSTWLSLAAGLLTQGAGEMVVAGQSVASLPPAERDRWRARCIGFLPQKLFLSEALTVADNLGLVYFASGLPVDRGAIGRALKALNLDALAARKPSQLSGGQAQRVALARALLLRPSVLLVDEPTASLDNDSCASALDLLRQGAAATGATLVIATHDTRVVQSLPQAQMLAFRTPVHEVAA